MRKALERTYARQQTVEQAADTFIEEISDSFGGTELRKREVLSTTEKERIEQLLFSNGYQLTVGLARERQTLEINAVAIYTFNPNYIEKITEKEWDLLLSLAVQRSLSLMEIPGVREKHSEYDKQIDKELSYLVPKLMIISGKATEQNF